MWHLKQEDFYELADGSGSSGRREELSRHIADCPQCRRELEFHRALVASLRKQPAVTITPTFIAKILSRITLARRSGTPNRLFTVAAALIPLVVVSAIVSGLVLFGIPVTDSGEDFIGTEVAGFVGKAYGGFKGILSQGSESLAAAVQQDSRQYDTTILLMGAIAVVVLIMLDRFVLRRVTKFRH